jgi:uncharacterized protein (DUF2236 family)
VISRRVNAERIVLFGWSRAILLQLAHPLIAAGVAEHSHFRSGARAAVSRLRGTVRTMLSLAFGDAASYGRSIAGIRTIHLRVHGELRASTGAYPAGTPYSAEDPDLVLWVHATHLDSVLMTYQCLVAPLSAAERDAYCEEAAGVAVALGAHSNEVPRTGADLERYLAREYASGRIAVGQDARLIGDAVLFPPLSLVTGPFAWTNRLLTLGLLPAPIRAQYRYRWSETRARQLQRTLRALRAARRLSPRAIAWWPVAKKSSILRAD